MTVVKFLDGAAIVQMLNPRTKKFQNYADMVFTPNISSQLDTPSSGWKYKLSNLAL